MKRMLWLALFLFAFSATAFEREVYYYGFHGEPVALERIDDGTTPWPVVSYGAAPMPLTGRVGFKQADDDRVAFIDLQPGEDPFAAARRIAGEPGVRWAQPEWLVTVRPLLTPNDPYFSDEWHLPQAEVPAAWDTTAGTAHTLVAFVDSGADFAHPDLAANLQPGLDLTGRNDPGCDRPPTASKDQLVAAHGTCVAGVIGAAKDNGIGVAGVCPACALFPVKFVCYDELTIPVSRIYDAIVAAVDAGADVINNSWGDEDTDASGNCVAVPIDSYRAEAIRYAKEKGRSGRGALVVWAAGNSECDTALNQNLAIADIIAVSALDSSGKRSWYSNFGDAVTFCAGAANWTTDITGDAGLNDKRYTTPEGALDYTNQFSGTSSAVAVLSGIAGLMYAANPLLSFAEAQRCLRLAAVRPPTTTCDAGGWALPNGDPYSPAGKERSPCFGYGIPDASALVAMARDGTCGAPYDGCDADAECGSGFRCDEATRECYKKPPSPQASGGCSLSLVDDAAPDRDAPAPATGTMTVGSPDEEPLHTPRETVEPIGRYINGTGVYLRDIASKNGRKLIILQRGDLVILTGNELSNEGVTWREITVRTAKKATLRGWVDERYLAEKKEDTIGGPSFLKTIDLSPFKKVKSHPGNPPVRTRGVYITVYSATPKNIRRYFALAESGMINTFVVDVKNVEGEILFKSAAAEKYFPAANKRVVYKSTPAFIAEARQKGIYLIARMTAFKDNYYALAYPDRGIMVPGTQELLRDRDKLVWVTPHDRHYWEYLIELSLEAAAMGFNEIQFDYLRFPDLNKEMDTRNTLNESRPQAIQNFLKYAYERLSKAGVYVAADIFGLVPSVADDMAIGQHWEAISNVVDYICPMMYPSHYATGFAALQVPDSDPYKTIRQSASDALKRNKRIPTPAIIRPWIQDFNAFWVKGHITYGAKEVEDQIRALNELGIDEYLVWNPRNIYTRITVPVPAKPQEPTPPPPEKPAPEKTAPAK